MQKVEKMRQFGARDNLRGSLAAGEAPSNSQNHFDDEVRDI